MNATKPLNFKQYIVKSLVIRFNFRDTELKRLYADNHRLRQKLCLICEDAALQYSCSNCDSKYCDICMTLELRDIDGEYICRM